MSSSSPRRRRPPTAAEVRAAAANRWPEILSSLAPVIADAIATVGSSRHHDCPVHGGDHGDAFRLYPDFAATGGGCCNSCGAFSDGIKLLTWLRNRDDYSAAKAEIAEHLNIATVEVRTGPGRPRGSGTATASGKHAAATAAANGQPTTRGPGRPRKEGGVGPTKSDAAKSAAASSSKSLIRAKLVARWQECTGPTDRIAAYLRHRGLDIEVPPSLRLHPSLDYRDPDGGSQRLLPAIVARVEHQVHGLVALHRTYLSTSSAGKADVPDPKKLTSPIAPGATRGAVIRLYPYPPSSPNDDPNADANPNPDPVPLALAEGIETALAIRQATGAPAWATLSSGNLEAVELPPSITHIDIWCDHGSPGEPAAEVAAARLATEGRTVRIIRPSTAIPLTLATDAVADEFLRPNLDWLDILDANGPEILIQAAAATTATVEAADAQPTSIEIHTKEHIVNAQAARALADCPNTYQRGGLLVHIVRDQRETNGGTNPIRRPPNAPRIQPLPKSLLRSRLTAVADWTKVRTLANGETIEIPAHPPEWAVEAALHRGEWPGVRYLEAVAENPVLLHDGRIITTPGYDDASGIYYDPPASTHHSAASDPLQMYDYESIANPSSPPTLDDARTAVATLLEPVADFPFASPAHQSAWLAAVLTPLARHAFTGPSPLFLVDANVRAAGKSLLCDLIAIIASGRDMTRSVNTTQDDEMRKRITAIAISADPLVLIDNVSDSLGCPSLDAALTSTTWSDRILGRSETTPAIPLCTTWYATGNNVQIKGDLARRILWVRLESPEENPEERDDFVHDNIRQWTRTNRHRLVAAALTILRAYICAGSPKQIQCRPWGSFENWSNLVRSALVWAGNADPGSTRTELISASESDVNLLHQLFSEWYRLDENNSGVTAAQLISMVFSPPEYGPDEFLDLRELFSELFPTPGGKPPTSVRVGQKLKRFVGRVIGGRYLATGYTGRTGVQTWLVKGQESRNQGVHSAGVAGVAGVVPGTPDHFV